MSVVLDLGANIECSSKNLLDFSIMGASLYTSLYPKDKPNVGLLNIGSEEVKGNDIIKETYQILNDKKSNNYDFAGYIEGNHLMDGICQCYCFRRIYWKRIALKNSGRHSKLYYK